MRPAGRTQPLGSRFEHQSLRYRYAAQARHVLARHHAGVDVRQQPRFPQHELAHRLQIVERGGMAERGKRLARGCVAQLGLVAESEQRLLEAESLDKAQQYEFIDLDTERRFISSTPLKLFVRDASGQLKQSYPQRIHVEERGVDVQYFTYILEPLTYILKAAVETGNPVRWS